MTTAYYRIDGQRLAQARHDAFLTQQQLSNASGVSLATIQGIEQPGRHHRYTAGQRAYTVVALANSVGIPPRNLLCKTVAKTVGRAQVKAGGIAPGKANVTPSKAFDLGVDLEVQALALVSQDQDLEATPPSPPRGFDEFWAAYPRKVGKIARTAFRAAVRKVGPEVVIAGAERLRDDPNLPDEFHIPHPTTWLHRGGWDDPPLAVQSNGQGTYDIVLAQLQRRDEQRGRTTGN